MANVAWITATARYDIATAINGTAPTVPKYLGWGTNPHAAGSSAAPSDVALYLEDTTPGRTTGTASVVTTTTTDDTFQVTGTITAGGDNPTIAEVGLFDGAPKAFGTTWSTAPSTTSGTSGTAAASYTPANNTYIQDSSGEVMEVTAGTGTTSLTVVRGANGSTAVSSANGNAITEGGIPGALISAGGNMFMHGTFTGVALTSGESIAFTVGIKIS